MDTGLLASNGSGDKPPSSLGNIISIAVQENNAPYILYNRYNNTYHGIFVNSLEAACRRLGFRVHYYLANNFFNSTLINVDSVMGAVINGTADAGLIPLAITASRLKTFDFVNSHIRRDYVAVIHKKHLITVDDSMIFAKALEHLLTMETWLAVLFVLMTFILVSSVSEYINNSGFLVANASFRQIVGDWSFRSLGIGSSMAGIEDIKPGPRIASWPKSKVILLATLIIYSLIMLTIITARLPVIFTFRASPRFPFTSVKSLLDSGFTVYGAATAIESLNNSEVPFHNTLAQKAILLPEPLDERRHGFSGFLDLASSSSNALIISQDVLLEMIEYSCDLITVLDNLVSVSVAALVLKKNSSLQSPFALGYQDFNAVGGIRTNAKLIDAYVNEMSRGNQDCYRRKIPMKLQGRMSSRNKFCVSLSEILFAFYLVAAGLILSFFVGIVEVKRNCSCSR